MEQIHFNAGDLTLEGLYTEGASEHGVVVTHPHPLYGGDMYNPVVQTIAEAYIQAGYACLQFNFRGVGSSQGVYAGGIGEVQDVGAVAEYVRHRWPDASIWLGGFSFGAVVAVRAAKQINPERLISIAPAVNILGRDLAAGIDSPWLIIQGALDEIVPAAAVAEWVDSLEPRPELVVLPAAGHFFHGQLTVLRETLIERLS